MARRLVAAAVLSPWLVWAVVRVSGVSLPYPVPSALAFTPYVALTAAVPVVVALALRQRAVAIVAFAAAAALAACVIPRAAGDPAQAAGPVLTVMSINLRWGSADPRTVMQLARDRDVDVLSLLEAQPEFLARLDALGARSRFPYRTANPVDEALLSGRPLAAARGPEGELRLAGGHRVVVTVVHPPPPLSPGAVNVWRAELGALPGTGKGPVQRLLVGDFNATLDHPELRDVLARGYRDAAAVTGAGWRPTWPSGRRFPPGITIDHVLADSRIDVTSYEVRSVPGTDHRALIVKLALR